MKGKKANKKNRMIRRFLNNKSALFGLVILIILVLSAILANFIAPNDP
ncbi:hypothetical protein LCGC14_2156660, partial [marine sediment metagenome]